MTQPAPIPNDSIDIQTLVIQDIERRREHGIQTYGTALQAHNGRNALVDAYEETLDLCMYLRQLLQEQMHPVAKRPTREDLFQFIAERNGEYKLPELLSLMHEATGLPREYLNDVLWELLDHRDIKFDRQWKVVVAT